MVSVTSVMGSDCLTGAVRLQRLGGSRLGHGHTTARQRRLAREQPGAWPGNRAHPNRLRRTRRGRACRRVPRRVLRERLSRPGRKNCCVPSLTRPTSDFTNARACEKEPARPVARLVESNQPKIEARITSHAPSTPAQHVKQVCAHKKRSSIRNATRRARPERRMTQRGRLWLKVSGCESGHTLIHRPQLVPMTFQWWKHLTAPVCQRSAPSTSRRSLKGMVRLG